jgi:hypothetical protein
MPKHSITFELPAEPSQAVTIARRTVAERDGWSVDSVADGRLVTRRGMRATAWPITLELVFVGAGPGTLVTADGKIGGWGPLQRKSLVRAMGELQGAMELDARAEQR